MEKLGAIGFQRRAKYGATGTVVNPAAGLCAEARDGLAKCASRSTEGRRPSGGRTDTQKFASSHRGAQRARRQLSIDLQFALHDQPGFGCCLIDQSRDLDHVERANRNPPGGLALGEVNRMRSPVTAYGPSKAGQGECPV